MPNPNKANASTDRPSAGSAHKRNRLLQFFRSGSSAPAATQSAAAAAGRTAPARPATPAAWTQRDVDREKAKAEQLRTLAQETQHLLPLVEFVQSHDPSMKAEYFAIKQAIFDKDLEGATARFRKFKPQLEQLERDVGQTQRSKASAQAKYLADIKKSGPGAAEPQAGDHLFRNLTGAGAASDLSSPKVQAAMKAHGLSEAEAVAIRVFTEQNYNYINPAVANQQDRPDRKGADGRDWMDLKQRPQLPPEAGAPYKFSAVFSEAPVKALQATLKAKGNGPIDPALKKLLDVIPKLGQGTLTMSCDDFTALRDACLPALPAPGQRNTVQQAVASFLVRVGTEIISWDVYNDEQAKLASAPEALKAHEEKRAALLAAQQHYDEGGADDKGSKRNLSLEGAAHAAMALQGLRKLPAEEVTLYRGFNLPPEAFDRQYRKAKSITCESVVSYSTDRSIAWGFILSDYKAGNVKVLLEIKTKLARDIMALSTNGVEAERVLLPGDKLNIVRIEGDPNKELTVHLEDA